MVCFVSLSIAYSNYSTAPYFCGMNLFCELLTKMSSYCSGDGLIFAIIQWYVVYEVFMINECHTKPE